MDFTKLKDRLRELALIEDVIVEEPPAAKQEDGETPEPSVSVPPEKRPAICEPDYKAKGFSLDVKVEADNVVEAAKVLDEEGFFLEAVTGVDWIKEKQLEVVYDYSIWEVPYRVVIRVRLDRENPVVPTVSGVFPGANWHERETFDFFGIDFSGHPDLTPILLPEDADFHPLLKDFKV